MTVKTMPPRNINLAEVPLPPEPGTWGVCHGTGLIAAVIRHATSSWAGHAVMYVGNGQIVEATWPKVRIASAPTNNVIWATGQVITSDQRRVIADEAMHLVGRQYDAVAYPFLIADMLIAALTQDANRLFANDRWWDCSGLIEHCDAVAGIPMFPESGGSAHFVTPSQLMVLGAQEGWFTKQ
jgi:hypothetical protein